MPSLNPLVADLAATVMDDKLRRPRLNRRQIDLVLTGLAFQAHGTPAGRANEGTVHFDRLINLLRHRAHRLLAVGFARLAAGPLSRILDPVTGKRCPLSLAAALLGLQLCDPPLQIGNLPLLLRDEASQLRVLFREVLVTWHRHSLFRPRRPLSCQEATSFSKPLPTITGLD